MKALRCRSVSDVQDAVRRAQAGELPPLYPFSTGLNWGYGGSEPVREGACGLDLSEMRRIRNEDEISPRNPVALIEPGVSQGQLADFLAERAPQLTFNVTGSGRDTSLIGNCLDRGVGYLGPRREDLFALEVVTGRGDLIYTGFRRLGKRRPDDAESPLAHVHPYGLGPMLDGLFFQSNFGIVTSACFRLMPRPERQLGVSLSLFDPARLGDFIDRLAALKREGVMGSVTHIGNRARTQASLSHGIHEYLEGQCGLRGDALAREAAAALTELAPFEWSSLGGVAGTKAQVKAALQVVRARMRGLARVMVLSDGLLKLGHRVLHPLRGIRALRTQAAAVHAARPLHGLALGQPTDAPIQNLLWKYGQPQLPPRQFADSRCGVLFISPALPMQGDFVQAFMARMQQEAARHGQTLYVTLNIETPMALVAVTNLLFDRSDAQQAERALGCARALQKLIRDAGLSVYRARTDMMAELVSADEPYWQLVRDLKQVLDPHHIIAQGRYNLA